MRAGQHVRTQARLGAAVLANLRNLAVGIYLYCQLAIVLFAKLANPGKIAAMKSLRTITTPIYTTHPRPPMPPNTSSEPALAW